MRKLILGETAAEKLPAKAQLLARHIPHLDPEATAHYLGDLSAEDSAKLKAGAFGSLAFEVVFSPGIIPKVREEPFKIAYLDFLNDNYPGPFFDSADQFLYQNEEVYHYDSELGPNNPEFLSEWVANLRAVYLLHRHFRPMDNAMTTISGNLIEAALCRMAEAGEQWPDNLFYTRPINIQERLYALRTQINEQIQSGQVLAPGEFFRIANELEFHQTQFLRGSVQDRVNMALEELEEHGSLAPPEPDSGLKFDPGVDWNQPTARQFRQVNLSSLMSTPDQAHNWTQILLGVKKTASCPPPLLRHSCL